MNNLTVAGTLSKILPSLETLPDQDLDTLRQLALHVDDNIDNHVVGIIENHGPNYIPLLAQLLNKRGKKVLLIDTNFNKPKKDKKLIGLLDVLEEEKSKATILNEEGFDRIIGGGISRFATEKLCSKTFSSFLSAVKKDYDLIFLITEEGLESTHSATLIKNVDSLAITLTGNHTIGAVVAFTESACDKITFVLS